MPPQNLMPEPPATLLPENTPAVEALKTEDPSDVARQWPDFPAAWAALSAKAMEAGDDVAAYAYARTGYHRALDQLRKNGWRGHGPVPWSHKPNRGFLTSLYRLSVAAAQIGEADEAARCAQFLRDSDPAAADALSSIG